MTEAANIITIEHQVIWMHRRADGVVVEVPHTDIEEWHEEDIHCPYCGVSPTYVEPGDGDYYVGPQRLCRCGATFRMQHGAVDEQRGYAIRDALEKLHGS